MTDFSKDSDELTEEDRKDADVLLANKGEILRLLAENGMNEDVDSPYTYDVPTWRGLDCGR